MISALLSLVLMTCTAPCSGMSWIRMSNRLCRRGASFPNLEAAQAACRNLGSRACPGVYNEHCDGQVSYLCEPASPVTITTSASCLYRHSRHISPFQPSSTAQLQGAIRTYMSADCDDVGEDLEDVEGGDDDELSATTSIAPTSPATTIKPRPLSSLDISIQYCGK